MREIVQTHQFKRELKKIASAQRYKKQDFLQVAEWLAMDMPLPMKNKDHALMGEWKEYRECYIKSDWLLIYKKYANVLLLVRTGSHSDLF